MVPYKLCFKLPGHFSLAAPECTLCSLLRRQWVTAGGKDPGAVCTGDAWKLSRSWPGRSIRILCCEGAHSLRQRRSAEMSASQI